MTRKFLLLLSALLCLPLLASAQGVRVDNPGGAATRSVQGFLAPIPGATITVCTSAGTGTPCTPLVPTSPVTLCTDSTCSVAASNPFFADANGNWGFWALPATYKVSITAPGVTGQLLTVTVPVSGGSSPTFTNLTVSGAGTFKSLNGRLYASQWCSGSTDLGVCINNAVLSTSATSFQPTTLIIDEAAPQTLTTSPNIPLGWTVEWSPAQSAALANWTLANTLPVNHRGTTWKFNGAHFNYNQDTGNAAILVGKNLSGTVNTANGGGCSGATVTWVSGSKFIDTNGIPLFDQGDVIIIATSPNLNYNVASVTSSTVLCVVGSTGALSGVAFSGLMTPDDSGIGQYGASPAIRNLEINYSGAGTNANDCALCSTLANDLYVENLSISNFTNGYGIRGQGMEMSQFQNLNIKTTKNALVLQSITSATELFGSHLNQFYSPRIIASPAGGNPVLIDASSYNLIQGGDFEKNAAHIFGTIQNGAIGNTVEFSDHETNGDGVANSLDWTVTGGTTGCNRFRGNNYTSLTAHTPDNALLVSTGCVDFEYNHIVPGGATYTTAYNYLAGTVGHVKGNMFPTGLTFVDPPFGLSEPLNSGKSPLYARGVDSATSAIGIDCGATTSGQGCFVHYTDNATYNSTFGAEGATGDMVLFDGRFQGTAGTERARIKRLTGTFRGSQYTADEGAVCTNGELALSAGWQSTGSATVTAVKGNGQTCEWTITTGTTTAANPTVTDTLTNALPNATTVCEMIITGGNRTAAASDSFDQTTLSATAPIFTFQGTPTAGGKTYQVVRRCGP